MSVHGCLLTIIGACGALYAGFVAGLRVGDARGIIGWAMCALAIATGLTWMLGW